MVWFYFACDNAPTAEALIIKLQHCRRSGSSCSTVSGVAFYRCNEGQQCLRLSSFLSLINCFSRFVLLGLSDDYFFLIRD